MKIIADIDFDSAFFTNPYAEYSRLRDKGSDVWSPAKKAWMVLGYKEIREGLQLRQMTSSRHSSVLSNVSGFQTEKLSKLDRFYSGWLMYMDGHSHAGLRKAVSNVLDHAVDKALIKD